MIPAAAMTITPTSAEMISEHDKEECTMCASFGFDFDNDGITSWEDDYFGQRITEDPIEKKDNVIYDACFDDVYLGEDQKIAS